MYDPITGRSKSFRGRNILRYPAIFDLRKPDNDRKIIIEHGNIGKHPLDIRQFTGISFRIPLFGSGRRIFVVPRLRIIDRIEEILSIIKHHLARLLRKTRKKAATSKPVKNKYFFMNSNYNPQAAASFCCFTDSGRVGKKVKPVCFSISATLLTQLFASP